MNVKSIKINSIMNTLKTFMSLVFPLITGPYALRVLQVDNIGKYDYGYSIINFFVLFAGLGISRYAGREGARKRENKEEFSTFASQMFTVNFFSTILVYIILFGLLMLSKKMESYVTIMLIQSITIIGTTLGLEWVNIACEDYTYITIRTISFQFISMILLFSFVKDECDLLNYVWISVFSNIGANILNFIHIRKYVKIRIQLRGIKQHLVPIILLFASTIASKIYVNADTVMLGLSCGDRSVGLYSVATRIYSIIQQLIAASIVVTLPRLSNYWAHEKKKEFQETIQNCFETFVTILLPITIGLFALAPEAIEIFGGSTYVASATILRILCVSLFFSVFGIFYTNTMLLPLKKEKEITIIMVISAATNIILNIFFIPYFEGNGAAITTVISEIIVVVLQVYVVRKHKLFKWKTKFWHGVLCGNVLVLVIILSCSLLIKNMIAKVVVTVTLSILSYGIVLVLSKNLLAMNALEVIRKKLKLLQ